MPTFSAPLQDGYTLQLIITQTSQNVSANTSTISGTLRVVRPSGQSDYTSYSTPWSTGTNGVTASGGTSGYDFRNYSILTLRSWTQTIAHNSDGTKSFTATGSFRETDPDPQVGYYGTNVIASGTVTLTTIPRASEPTMSASSANAGSSITILTHRASASFTHTITYKLGSQTGTIATKTTSADVNWNIPMSILNGIPNATSGNVTITVETFNGNTSLGSNTTSFTVTADSSVKPTISSISHSEAVADVATDIGAYVQNNTKLTMTINGEAGVYGSTISTRKIVVAGQTVNADSGTTSNVINASGTVPIVATVTDSRGRSTSLTQNVTVLPYAPPAITSAVVQRATAGGVPDPQGTTIRLDFSASTQSLVNGTEKNNLQYAVFSRLRGDTIWTSKVALTTASTTTSSGRLNFTGMVLINTYAVEDSWEIKLEVGDTLSAAPTPAIGTVSTAAIDVHFDANLGVGVGKFRENGRLDVAGDIYLSGDIQPSDGDLTIGGSSSRVYIPGSVQSRRIIRNASKTVATGTWTLLDAGWTDNQPNIGGITYSAGILTVPVDGIYLLNGSVCFGSSGNTTGMRLCRLYINGSTFVESPNSPPYSTTGSTRAAVTIIRRLNAGETVGLWAHQNSGVNVDVVADPSSILEVTLISRL